VWEVVQAGRWRELGLTAYRILTLLSCAVLLRKSKSSNFLPFDLFEIEIRDDVGRVSCVEHGDGLPAGYTVCDVDGGPIGYTIKCGDGCPAFFSVVPDLCDV
jgi:hypothetical protein